MKQYIWRLFPLLALGALSVPGGCCSRTVPSELSHCDRELSTRVVSVRIVPGAILPLPTGEVE